MGLDGLVSRAASSALVGAKPERHWPAASNVEAIMYFTTPYHTFRIAGFILGLHAKSQERPKAEIWLLQSPYLYPDLQ
jgi:hypothetical protein